MLELYVLIPIYHTGLMDRIDRIFSALIFILRQFVIGFKYHVGRSMACGFLMVIPVNINIPLHFHKNASNRYLSMEKVSHSAVIFALGSKMLYYVCMFTTFLCDISPSCLPSRHTTSKQRRLNVDAT